MLEKCLGVISTACTKTKLSRTQVYKWIKDDKEFADEVDYVRNELCVDFAESNLFQQIKKGSTSATIFFLKTRGKHRGYIETMEVENRHSGGVNIEFEDFEEQNTEQE